MIDKSLVLVEFNGFHCSCKMFRTNEYYCCKWKYMNWYIITLTETARVFSRLINRSHQTNRFKIDTSIFRHMAFDEGVPDYAMTIHQYAIVSQIDHGSITLWIRWSVESVVIGVCWLASRSQDGVVYVCYNEKSQSGQGDERGRCRERDWERERGAGTMATMQAGRQTELRLICLFI